jgi:hypothetical protein
MSDSSAKHRTAVGRSRKALAMLLATLALAATTTAIAGAELTSKGNLFVTFKGGILPDALPRDERAPITVWMEGKVRTLKGEDVPSLQTITIALNRFGHLDTEGLPVCRRGQIEAATRAQALASCRDSLVGTGTYRARSTFPEQARSPTFGRILAFHSRLNGKEAILGHVFGEDPAPTTTVIPFSIRRTNGLYRTVLTGNVPEGLTRWGYLKRISLRLHRNYTFRGERHSYLSAPCPAPRGLNKATFPFAFTAMKFVDGRELSAKLTRSCRTR